LVRSPMPSPKYIDIEVDGGGIIKGHRRLNESMLGKNINMATGAYVLNHKVFDYELVKLSNGEYGLPQTILKMAQDVPMQGVFMENWHQINSQKDLQRTEAVLKSV